jgi:hypothetical protein
MPTVLLRHTPVAIKTAGGQGYGPLKLKLRHSNIYYNVISLLLCFGHPPITMDAVSATIVAGGQAKINYT